MHSMIHAVFNLSVSERKAEVPFGSQEKQHEESLRTIEALKSRFKYFWGTESLSKVFCATYNGSGKGLEVRHEFELSLSFLSLRWFI